MFGKPEDPRLLGRLLSLSQVGVEMVAPAIVGLLIDRWLGISPWGLIVGTVLGFVGALIHLVVLTQPQPGEDEPGKGKEIVTARVRNLVLAGATFWVLLGLPARYLLGEEHLLFSGVAVLICLVPGILTLVWASWAFGQDPQQLLLAFFGATGVRMFVVLIAAGGLFLGVEAFRRPAFMLWVAGAYLVLLAVEVILLVRVRREQPGADSGA